MHLVSVSWAATVFCEAACWIGPLAAAKFAGVLAAAGSAGFRVAAEIIKRIEHHREVVYIGLQVGQISPRWGAGVIRDHGGRRSSRRQ